MSRRIDRTAVHLFCLMFVQYGVLTFNTSAIAHNNRWWLFCTDLVIAWLNFSILKKVAEATNKGQAIAYTAGGALGAQVALLVSAQLIR